MLGFKKLSMITTGTVLMILGAVGKAPDASAATFVGPTPYLSFNDSPFKNSDFSYFHLENFEDGLLNVPGTQASNGYIVSTGRFRDSVDSDDGSIDGSGSSGSSWYPYSSNVKFTFNKNILGSLPTHVGIVWTDIGYQATTLYYGRATFEAYDPSGNSLGVITALLGDGSAMGGTAEDRFFGATNESGISALRISMDDTRDWEVDHLQYGAISSTAAVPEPTTIAGLAIATSGLLAARRRQKSVAAKNG